MVFTNKPNEEVKLEDGRVVWLSRSPAVNTFVLAHMDGDNWFLLMDRRGKGVPDWSGYWNTPCGYVDWNETLADAAIREIFEETGVDMHSVMASTNAISSSFMPDGENIPGQPFLVEDYPSRTQNITHHFYHLFRCEELPLVSNENNEPGETTDIMWVPLRDAFLQKKVAFGQLNTLKVLLRMQGLAIQIPYGC